MIDDRAAEGIASARGFGTSPLVFFPGPDRPGTEEVGGKARSLIRMSGEAGLAVPPGAVLTTSFFVPWFAAIRDSAAWERFESSGREGWATACEEMKRLCSDLALEPPQRGVLEDLRRGLETSHEGARFAVRSSSPEEDLESASFAGGYETVLGVRDADLEAALRLCFASALDERVFVYKSEHGFDPLSPRLAVIVQRQIASDVAGVAFSLNPLTNDHDEAVVDSSWGLGEAVVAGLTSPDHFVVDRVSGELIAKSIGAKQVSIWLDRDRGTIERAGHRSNEISLSKAELGEVVTAVGRIEELYGGPVDVEWALADSTLHILQARPITTFVPVPPEMLTRPGERRRLYVDAGLSQGLTTNEPISPLGLSWIVDVMYGGLLRRFVGIRDFTPAGGLVFSAGCRFYMNLSNGMWLGMSPRSMARNAAHTDALLAEVMASVDARRYRAKKRPAWMRLGLAVFLPRALWSMRGLVWNLLRNVLVPARGRRVFERRARAFETRLAEVTARDLSLGEFARSATELAVQDLFGVTLPAVIAGLASPGLLVRRRQSDEVRSLADKLGRGFVGNLVVEQGIALFRLARMLDRADFADLDALSERIDARRMDPEFLAEWDEFLRRFGCRGPHEMDPAQPRYADSTRLALEQMQYMAGGSGFDPEVVHRHHVDERREAYLELLRRWGWLRRALLRRIHRLIELFAGTRDTPKYHVVQLTYAIRRRALREGEKLVAAGRLDAAEDVFGLTFADLEAASRDPALDLRALAAEHTRFARETAAHVTEFPQVFDSRGRILRPPPRPGKPGELTGMAVSPGSARGPVKVLRTPREKPIEEGDVLVAYTTDPGWTPLFVNAAAVVLEVGGVLQHGAVIAREYGKPCVAGVDRVVSKLRDGQVVEVDGTAGVIRLAPES